MSDQNYKLKKHINYGYLYVDPTPSQEEIEAFYKNEFYSTERPNFNDSQLAVQQKDQDFYNFWRDFIIATVEQDAGKKINSFNCFDIGCGWGGLMRYAAEHYGVSCVGISISKEQTKWAREYFKDFPCEIEIIDYRDFKDDTGFDYVTCIEMTEHVGPKNYNIFYEKVHSLLKPQGKFLLQAIGSWSRDPQPDPWIDKYIFPL